MSPYLMSRFNNRKKKRVNVVLVEGGTNVCESRQTVSGPEADGLNESHMVEEDSCWGLTGQIILYFRQQVDMGVVHRL